MKNDKNLNLVGELKTQLNPPKTETRIILETQDLYPDLSQRSNKSKLSPAARQKIVNHNKPYQSLNQEGYGPCSYSGCPYSTDFDISISIEGNRRKWAKSTGVATWLPGTWETGFWTSHYESRWDLWLPNIDYARRVDPLLVNDTIYTVNLMGVHCAEDNKFCNSALEVIRAAVRHHEGGWKTVKSETINSNISKWSRYAFKTGAAVGAGFVNPGAAIAIGAGAMGAGKVGQAACGSGRGKAFWGTVSDMGQEGILGGISKNISNKYPYPDAFPGASKPNKLIDTVRNIAEPIGGSLMDHMLHGVTKCYDSDCPFCG